MDLSVNKTNQDRAERKSTVNGCKRAFTVSRGTYLGIDQSMKRKFVSKSANTRLVICLCFVFAFSGLVQFHYHSRDNTVS